MKKSVITVLVMLYCIGQKAQVTPATNPSAAKMKFDTELIDYGTVEHNGDGTRDFKFTNTGNDLLVISDVKTSCGCLVAQFPKEPIKPGSKGVIKVHYATDRIGHFEKTVTVYSNDSDREIITLKVKGNVLPSP